jgi:hypothetical protein
LDWEDYFANGIIWCIYTNKKRGETIFSGLAAFIFFGYQSEFTEKTNSISKRIRMSVQLFAGYLKQKDIKQ